MHEKFEAWIKAQPFYTKLIYIHGERLFIRDNGEYQIFAMEVALQAWRENYEGRLLAISLFESKSKTVESLLKKGKKQQQEIDLIQCNCPGCMRQKLNLGGYQPCSCKNITVSSPPKKP
ncbi:hypothetical protein OZZ14_09585 [Acinetobacter baumannii]|uniref:hypothetical protein n=1 Tax=Acinetobacter calcoaceticus/baumannii complex TaxID=909768 RepID=UPI000A395818|nr:MULTISPECIES: hypothetical protein [Acinetobacter calcoaceticus/baumannii complex]MBH8249359.1 hypothetical protein [Acinetobacter baumannii]MCW1512837.1 hypothetical protein [Acinetobacter baumannii]MCZ0697759.1 hypothetical protein [Acinetobacter baumannii]MDA3480735.1 hypothetical protein [Acinetobacter baumannii]MDC4538231.1 hypothetical protein [Acinetobacter baumannii]